MTQTKNTIKALLFLLLPWCAAAQAGHAEGKILGFIPYSMGSEEMFFINVDAPANVPLCNTTRRFTMKASHPRFKATRAAALTAFAAGTPVRANGTGTCQNFANSEGLDYLCLGQTPC